MSFVEKIEQASGSLIMWALGGIATGLGWLVRRILTNQRQIEILSSELKSRDERRQEDREIVDEIKTDVREIRNQVQQLFQRD